MDDDKSQDSQEFQQFYNVEEGISASVIEKNTAILTKSMMTRLLDLEMRCKASDTRIMELEKGWKKTKAVLHQIRPKYATPWRVIGPDHVDQDHEEGIFQISYDLYCVLATSRIKKFPFWFSLFVIFGFQFTLLYLLATGQLDLTVKTETSVKQNTFQIPANVEPEVRVAQVLILAIALFSQRDLFGGVENFYRGRPTSYRGAKRFGYMSSVQWRFAAIARICQGLAYLFCVFILSVQSETVSDVLLNVLGASFVSELDDLVFHLGTLGYFGGQMKHLTLDIQQCDFVRETKQVNGQRYFFVWFRKSFHTIVAFVMLGILLYFYMHLKFQQDRGDFNAKYIFVEMSDDESNGVYNTLSGCYVASEESYNGRLTYEQVGAFYKPGLFVHCPDMWSSGRDAWVLTRVGDPCESPDYHAIMISDTTNEFDLLVAGTKEWYSDLRKRFVFNIAMEDNFYCEDIRSKEDGGEKCSVIQGAGSLPLQLVKREKFQPKEDWSVALTRDIYMSRESTDSDGKEVVFFTGRNWVMTTERRLLGNFRVTSTNGTEVWEDFDPDANILEEMLVAWVGGFDPDTLQNMFGDWGRGGGSVNFISEKLDPKSLQYSSPHGNVQWYYPRPTTFGVIPDPDESRPAGSFSCIGCMTNSTCNAGYCNQTTRQCECRYNETGTFCENPPMFNGVCDDFFNKNWESVYSDTYDYYWSSFDGGDCCAPSCWLPHCGKDGLQTLFGLDISEEHLAPSLTNSSADELIGFQKCQDVSFSTILLKIVPVLSAIQVCVPPFTVQCDGFNTSWPGYRTYLRTPFFCTFNVTSLKEERIMAPPGVGCNLTMDDTIEASGIEKLCVRRKGVESCLVEASSGTFGQVLEWTVPAGFW